jgi:tetratricopeptide (TPR) repeat protein
LARAIELQGRGDRAVAHLETALIKDSNNPDVTLALATTLIRLGKVDEGTHHLEKTLTADPENPRTAFAAAAVFFDLGDFERAQTLYRRSLQHNPFWSEAYNNLGNCFFRQSRYERARAAYETALALAPESDMPRRNLALIWAREGEYDRALEILGESPSAFSNSSDINRLTGDLLSLSGKYSEAIGYYERHLAIFRGDTECLFQIAEAYRKLGHFESAAAGYRHVLKMSPNHKAARKRLGTLQNARAIG